MMFEKVIQPAKNHGWKEQVCSVTGMCGSLDTDLYKDGKALTVSTLDEWQVTYPDEDEIRELFGEK
jgi:hypothetical protein